MAKINITKLATEAEMFEFSASRAERGQNAGPETWTNAKAEAAERPILSGEDLDAFRDHVRGFGAWDDEEIDAWDETECNALFVQMVAGDMRDLESLCPGDGVANIDWRKAEDLAQRGTVSGRVYSSGLDVFYCVDD